MEAAYRPISILLLKPLNFDNLFAISGGAIISLVENAQINAVSND